MEDVEIELEYDAILIDTSIFDGNGLRLETGLLSRVKQFKNSPIQFIVPDIIKNEVQAHLEREINKCRNLLEKALNNAGQHLFFDGSELNKAKQMLIDSSEIKNLAKSRLNNYLYTTGAFVLNSDDFVSVGSLVDMYFNNEPPFSETGKKKNEFPDAIALMAVEKWAGDNDRSVMAIAKDKDWKAFCEDADYIDYQDDLSAGLSFFNQANIPFTLKENIESSIAKNRADDFLSKIESHLKDILSELTPDQEANSYLFWEPEGIFTKYKEFELSDGFKIIEVDENWIVLQANATITIEAEGFFTLFAEDSIDGDNVSLGGIGVVKLEQFDSKVLITLSGELDEDINKLLVEEVEVLKTPTSIHFGTLEPEFC